MRRYLATTAIATIGMGVTVAVSWLAIGIRSESFGLDPASMMRPSRVAIYLIQFALVGLVGVAVRRMRLRNTSMPTFATVMAAGWLGEGAVLTVLGESLVANELDLQVAWYFWLVATAGPIQPLIAILGGWIAVRPVGACGAARADDPS